MLKHLLWADSFLLARLHTFFSRSWKRSVSKDVGIRWRGREWGAAPGRGGGRRCKWGRARMTQKYQQRQLTAQRAKWATGSSCSSETASRNNMSNRLDQSKSNLDPQWELKMLITEWKLLQGRKIISHSSTRENSQVLYFTNCSYCIFLSYPLEFHSFNKVIVWKQFHYACKWNILIIWALEHSLYFSQVSWNRTNLVFF